MPEWEFSGEVVFSLTPPPPPRQFAGQSLCQDCFHLHLLMQLLVSFGEAAAFASCKEMVFSDRSVEGKLEANRPRIDLHVVRNCRDKEC